MSEQVTYQRNVLASALSVAHDIVLEVSQNIGQVRGSHLST